MKARTRITRTLPALLLICGIFLSLLLCACGESKKDAVLPPIRMSEHLSTGNISGSLTSIEDELNDSDAVACVRIGDWLGDTADTVTTMFDAEVTEAIKGELPKSITLLQDGTSKSTFRGYPLFTAGNELLVFLKKAKYANAENAYYITGTHFTVFDIVTIESGEKYVLPRQPALALTLSSSVRELSGDRQLREKVFDGLKNADSVWNEVQRDCEYFYSLDELVSVLKEG